MNDPFEKKVRAAAVAVAGWWIVLISIAFLLIQWLAFRAISAQQPAWLLSLWGPELTWSFAQTLWLWVIAIFKLCVWLMILASLWLTLWARQLRKG